MTLTCVISGGQTGADIGGVAAAKSMNVPTGGWMPRHWVTEDGHHPEYAELYGMREHAGGYRDRTIQNIIDATGTLIVATNWTSPGTIQTIRTCEREGKPYFKIDPVAEADIRSQATLAAQWIIDNNIKVLNVAGNRESKSPGLAALTYEHVRSILATLAAS